MNNCVRALAEQLPPAAETPNTDNNTGTFDTYFPEGIWGGEFA